MDRRERGGGIERWRRRNKTGKGTLGRVITRCNLAAVLEAHLALEYVGTVDGTGEADSAARFRALVLRLVKIVRL